jgi:hypothetical protein
MVQPRGSVMQALIKTPQIPLKRKPPPKPRGTIADYVDSPEEEGQDIITNDDSDDSDTSNIFTDWSPPVWIPKNPELLPTSINMKEFVKKFWFSQNSISSTFGKNTKHHLTELNDTIYDILQSGPDMLSTFKPIEYYILKDDKNKYYVSCDNRRLCVFKTIYKIVEHFGIDSDLWENARIQVKYLNCSSHRMSRFNSYVPWVSSATLVRTIMKKCASEMLSVALADSKIRTLILHKLPDSHPAKRKRYD